jgi:hypothetical protein
MVVAVEYPVSGHSSNSPQMAMPDSEVRTAKITRDPDGKGAGSKDSTISPAA